MTTLIVEQSGTRYLTFAESPQGTLSSKTIGDIIEECLGKGITRVLAEEAHLPEDFFRLGSLEAGEVLQKFRTYGIRLAVVVSSRRLHAGRFGEMVSEEKKGRSFAAFTGRREAVEWLLSPD